jgi:hypothetical protein
MPIGLAIAQMFGNPNIQFVRLVSDAEQTLMLLCLACYLSMPCNTRLSLARALRLQRMGRRNSMSFASGERSLAVVLKRKG